MTGYIHSLAETLAEAIRCVERLQRTPAWLSEPIQAPARKLLDAASQFPALRGQRGQDAAESAGSASTALVDAAGTGTTSSDARHIIQELSELFGSPQSWHARVRLAFTPSLPDASRHDPDVAYLRGLIEVAGLSQRDVANRIGIGYRLLKYYLVTPTGDRESRVATYTVQYAIERLAASRVRDAGRHTE